jgi:hypothetical protein
MGIAHLTDDVRDVGDETRVFEGREGFLPRRRLHNDSVVPVEGRNEGRTQFRTRIPWSKHSCLLESGAPLSPAPLKKLLRDRVLIYLGPQVRR